MLEVNAADLATRDEHATVLGTPVASAHPRGQAGHAPERTPGRGIGQDVGDEDAALRRQPFAEPAEDADAPASLGDVAVAVPGEDEDVEALGQRRRDDI